MCSDHRVGEARIGSACNVHCTICYVHWTPPTLKQTVFNIKLSCRSFWLETFSEKRPSKQKGILTKSVLLVNVYLYDKNKKEQNL